MMINFIGTEPVTQVYVVVSLDFYTSVSVNGDNGLDKIFIPTNKLQFKRLFICDTTNI